MKFLIAKAWEIGPHYPVKEGDLVVVTEKSIVYVGGNISDSTSETKQVYVEDKTFAELVQELTDDKVCFGIFDTDRLLQITNDILSSNTELADALFKYVVETAHNRKAQFLISATSLAGTLNMTKQEAKLLLKQLNNKKYVQFYANGQYKVIPLFIAVGKERVEGFKKTYDEYVIEYSDRNKQRLLDGHTTQEEYDSGLIKYIKILIESDDIKHIYKGSTMFPNGTEMSAIGGIHEDTLPENRDKLNGMKDNIHDDMKNDMKDDIKIKHSKNKLDESPQTESPADEEEYYTDDDVNKIKCIDPILPSAEERAASDELTRKREAEKEIETDNYDKSIYPDGLPLKKNGMVDMSKINQPEIQVGMTGGVPKKQSKKKSVKKTVKKSAKKKKTASKKQVSRKKAKK